MIGPLMGPTRPSAGRQNPLPMGLQAGPLPPSTAQTVVGPTCCALITDS